MAEHKDDWMARWLGFYGAPRISPRRPVPQADRPVYTI
jgi:hypothetical protein